jgi:hypothetical protein
MRDDADLFTDDDWEGPRNFAYFFAAAIVVDTYYFKPALLDSKW